MKRNDSCKAQRLELHADIQPPASSGDKAGTISRVLKADLSFDACVEVLDRFCREVAHVAARGLLSSGGRSKSRTAVTRVVVSGGKSSGRRSIALRLKVELVSEDGLNLCRVFIKAPKAERLLYGFNGGLQGEWVAFAISTDLLTFLARWLGRMRGIEGDPLRAVRDRMNATTRSARISLS
jgi:hypothetical protein